MMIACNKKNSPQKKPTKFVTSITQHFFFISTKNAFIVLIITVNTCLIDIWKLYNSVVNVT